MSETNLFIYQKLQNQHHSKRHYFVNVFFSHGFILKFVSASKFKLPQSNV
jgi:hypothetical protein